MGGYAGIGPEAGKLVPEEEAYDYALERCVSGSPDEQMGFRVFIGLLYCLGMPGWRETAEGSLKEQKEFREAFVEWYYSGNWVWEDQIAEDRDYCVGDYKGRTA